MVFEDVSSDVECGNLARPDRYESASFAVAPLQSGSGIFGVICATDRAGGGRFGSDDLALLRLLAMQLAELVAAADGASLADEPASSRDDAADAAESDRDADLAREICLAISDEVEPERVIEAALKPMSTLLPAAPVALYLVDATSGELRREGECDGGLSGDREVLARDRGLTGTVLQTGCVVATHEPDADPRFDAEMDTPENGEVRPFFCLPLRLRGKVVGLCRAFLEEGAMASPRTGEVLSAALSAAVRNALLYRSLLESIEDVAEARRTARQ
jgi:GAF domain-containing protein